MSPKLNFLPGVLNSDLALNNNNNTDTTYAVLSFKIYIYSKLNEDMIFASQSVLKNIN